MDDLPITPNIVIAARDLSWKAVRASGPGGQNVNKVATKVELCFNLAESTDLNESTKTRLRRLAARYIDANDQLLISSQTTRAQRQNLSLALDALAALIRLALVVPKKRRKTKPTRASKAARVRNKLHQAKKKQTRSRVVDDA
jgi:ribosome-associated protein